MRAHFGELVGAGLAAHDTPVMDIRLSGQSGIAYDNAVIANLAVVRNVGIGHDERVASDTGYAFSAGLGAPVDGGALADVHPVSNFHPAFFSLEFEVLRDGAHYGAREYGAVLSHFYVVQDGGSVHDVAGVSNFYMVVNIGERAHNDIFSQFGSGMYAGKGMNLIHSYSRLF